MRSGVRLGKCQARTNPNLASPPAGTTFRRHTVPTWFRSRGSSPRDPAAENASQNRRGLFHHLPRGQPRHTVTSPGSAVVAASRKLPCSTSSGGSPGLVITRPFHPEPDLNSFTRFSAALFCSGVEAPRPTGLSIDQAMATCARSAPGFLTVYRRNATGSPESSAFRGKKGLNASSDSSTGTLRSWKSMRAMGNSPVKVAPFRRRRPGEFSDPSPSRSS